MTHAQIKHLKDQCIVLKLIPVAEQGGVATVISQQLGRIGLYIKNRYPNKQALFCPAYELSLELSKKPQSDLYWPARVNITNAHHTLHQSLEHMLLAQSLLEDCHHLLPLEHPESIIYQALQTGLSGLVSSTQPEQLLKHLLMFEEILITTLGYGEPSIFTTHSLAIEDLWHLFDRHTQKFKHMSTLPFYARDMLVSVFKKV